MKLKIGLLLIASIICIFVYKITYKPKKILLSIGDNSCLSTSIHGAIGDSYNKYLIKNNHIDVYNEYCFKNITIRNIISSINNNSKYDNQTIKSLLDKSNIIIINIGFFELSNYKDINNLIIRDFVHNYNELLKLVNKYSKAKVYVLGYYPGFFNNEDIINKKIEQLCRNYNYIFIETSKLSKNKDNFYELNHYNLNKKGNIELSKLINKYL